jgi:hypothetical protein
MKNNNIPNNNGIKGSQIAHMQNQAPRVAARMEGSKNNGSRPVKKAKQG